MKQVFETSVTNSTVSTKEVDKSSTTGELVVKGVATAVAATAIIEVGKEAMIALSRQPLVVFGLGIATGFFTHKYRKEIIAISNTTTEQSKKFVLRQKESLKELLAESQSALDD